MKSPAVVSLSAVGTSPWIPMSYIQRAFSAAIACILSTDGNLTYSVQQTYDQIDDSVLHPITISRTTVVATVTDVAHGLSAGDTVIITDSGSSNLDSPKDSGGRALPITVATAPTANTYTYAVANSGSTTDNGFARGKNLRVFPHAVLTALTARLDSNYNIPVMAVRLIVTAYTAGKVDMLVVQGTGS